MADKFIQISMDFYNAHGSDIRLNPAKANDGNYYVDVNCLNTCPDLFTGNEPIVELDASDFPKQDVAII